MTVQCLPRYSDAYEAAVDDAIASCDGSLRGALKVLIIANEFLERDLEKALASDPDPSIGMMVMSTLRCWPKWSRRKLAVNQ